MPYLWPLGLMKVTHFSRLAVNFALRETRSSCSGIVEVHVGVKAMREIIEIAKALFIVIARAVAGMLYHLKAISPDRDDFDQAFEEGLEIYNKARNEDELQKHAVRTIPLT